MSPRRSWPLSRNWKGLTFQLKGILVFQRELKAHLKDYVGRPTPLYFAERLTEELKGRKDLPETGRSDPYGCS